MKPLAIGVALVAVLSVLLPGLPTRAIAAERPANPSGLLLWLLSLDRREQVERPKIDVNSATAEALTALPGLDRRQALRIIAHRPYATLHELVRAGLTVRYIERLTGLLTVHPPHTGDSSERRAGVAGAAVRGHDHY